ncbi:beta-1,3-galactosyltransferase 5-like [Arctopsyche grandis]|uniref:beta-1,3-galactosyltransferase 5-like n=1 Tax=Arctopsyche grandis TaxID=121162 RepID=UPI00406D712F
MHRIVMIITSYAGHVELRSAHRRTFSNDDLDEMGIKRVFLLSKLTVYNEMQISQKAIEHEHFRFGDIIQGNFIEAYRNLTLKHIMGLKWTSTQCNKCSVVLKLDDDIVFNINAILNCINSTQIDNDENFLMGYVLRGMKPIRLKANKWYVTYNEYSKSFYPPFLSGWMYFTNPKTAGALVRVARETPYFWIDDVFVTGILASTCNIKLKDIKFQHMFLEYFELMDCCVKDMIDKKIMCEYAIGPNGNDDNMLVKFNDALKMCAVNKCSPRPINRSLNDTCISAKRSFPINIGNPSISVLRL